MVFKIIYFNTFFISANTFCELHLGVNETMMNKDRQQQYFFIECIFIVYILYKLAIYSEYHVIEYKYENVLFSDLENHFAIIHQFVKITVTATVFIDIFIFNLVFHVIDVELF